MISCLKHGDFSLIARDHIRGSGCTKCNESVGEQLIRMYLEKNNIRFEQEKRIKKLGWLDFFVNNNLVIEFNGAQHYCPIDFSNKGGNVGILNLESNVIRDYNKKKWCKDNHFIYLEIPFWEEGRINELLDQHFSGLGVIYNAPPNSVKEFDGFRKLVNYSLM